MNSDNKEIPHLIKIDTFPLDLEDRKRFVMSKWNYFMKDPVNRYVAGFWEAEQGEEHLGGSEEFDEFMIILKGEALIAHDDVTEKAGPGSCIYVKRNRPVTIKVGQRIEAFFFCIPMGNIEAYEEMAKNNSLSEAGD